MSHSAEHHLSMAAEDYDREIVRMVIGYEAMHNELVEALAAYLPADATARILDVGAGTGALSARIASRLPGVALTLVDIDAAMLAQAQQRLAAHRGRVTLQRGSFLEPLPACEAAVAAISLHHVRDLGQKRSIYRNIYQALTPGGIFLDADVAIPHAQPLAQHIWRRWAAHNMAHGDTEEQAYARFAEWAKEDTYFSLEEEFQALQDTGFSAVEVIYRAGPMRVLAAIR